MIVNKKELAGVFRVTERTLTDWHNKGMPIKVSAGRGKSNEYDVADVIAWRLEFVASGQSQESQKERKDRLEGDRLAIQLAKEAGLLIAREDVEPLWESAVVAARSELLASAKKLKTKLDKVYELDVDIKLILEHVDATLTRLAETTPDGEDDDAEGDAEMEATVAA